MLIPQHDRKNVLNHPKAPDVGIVGRAKLAQDIGTHEHKLSFQLPSVYAVLLFFQPGETTANVQHPPEN